MRRTVLDASAVADYLIVDRPPGIVAASVRDSEIELLVPSLCDVEIVSVLRRLVRQRRLPAGVAEGMLRDYLTLRLVRFEHRPLVPRMFELRDIFTAYDAAYVALAEAADAPLVTADRRLARAAARLRTVEIVPA
ncbi:MAG: PIN domain-containing protein [Actinomycetota bacterium]